MPFGNPINWSAPVICDNCHKTIQRASIKRHKREGCLHWRSFSQAYLNSQQIKEDLSKN
tara:strand:+ start:418 stop:594 length:177 start_codon:yes stop_codon:yes gene_type:complete